MSTKPSHRRRSALDALAAKGFARVADASRATGNKLRLLRDAGENYPAWLNAIAGARRTVHLENYILEEDKVGQSFADALADAARRGVRTRVLYDWFGSRTRTSRRFWTALRQAGVEVRCYNPPKFDSPLGWISRDHRKVLCVDGEVGFTGGLCIGHDWAGNPTRGVAPWRDTGVEVRGPAVAHLEHAFADSWATAGPPISADELVSLKAIPAAGDLELWVIAGHPNDMGLYRLEQLVAELAERSLWISDAYFVATTGYVRALCAAARNGVDVRLLVPGSNNFPVVQALSRAGYRPLLEAGVRVFEWNGPMMHAKTAVADGCWARVGSSNSNMASWVSNRELDIAIEDSGFAQQMEAMFERDLTGATEVVLDLGRVRSTLPKPPRRKRRRGARTGSAGRLVAGAAGLGSAVSAALSQKRALGATEAKLMAAAGAIALILAVAMVIVPDLIAYPLALAGAWVGVTLVVRALKLRNTRRPAPEGRSDENR